MICSFRRAQGAPAGGMPIERSASLRTTSKIKLFRSRELYNS
jgi:hypothetical protein